MELGLVLDQPGERGCSVVLPRQREAIEVGGPVGVEVAINPQLIARWGVMTVRV